MNKIDYKDKVCVVTGAASGIGYATVKMLLEMEAKVYALDINEVNIDNLITINVDLSSKESIDDAFERLPEHIDCFFGVAGLSGAVTNYYKTFTVNYIANKYITEEYLSKRMSTGGAICYVTSTAGLHWEKYQKEYQLFTKAKTWEDMIHVLEYQAKPDTVGVMAYPLSKRAMNHYMAEAAYKLGEQGIRVNALLPGSTDTGMKKEFEVEAGGEEQLISHTGVAKRLATPEEMAEPLLFLNSNMASFISGETLIVDYASTAMSYIGVTKDTMDIKVGSKLFNLSFIQTKLKKQLEPLNTETKSIEENDKTEDKETIIEKENSTINSDNNTDTYISNVNDNKNNDFTINEDDLKYLNSIDYNSLLKTDNNKEENNDQVEKDNNSDDEIL